MLCTMVYFTFVSEFTMCPMRSPVPSPAGASCFLRSRHRAYQQYPSSASVQ